MHRYFSIGLIGRIVIALAVIFASLILINELTVSSVVHLALKNAQTNSNIPTDWIQNKHHEIVSAIRKPVLLYTITAAIVSLLVASLAIHRIAVKPIRRISQALEDVANGKKNVRVPVQGARELLSLTANFNQMIGTIKQQQETLESQLATLKKTTSHLKETQQDLIQTAKLASIGTLASGVAHEIGNPIAGILGLLDALDIETDPKAAQTYRNLVKKEIERIDKTIRDLLQYARPSSSSHRNCTSLPPVLTHVETLLKMQKMFHSINVVYASEIPIFPLAMEEDDLTSIFVNLFLNAAQAMKGRGTITIDCTPSDTIDKQSNLQIHVRDNGPGVPSEYASQIFDPFFSHRKKKNGSGLGLSICQSICERYHAHINLNQSYQAGAEFCLSIPLAPQNEL